MPEFIPTPNRGVKLGQQSTDYVVGANSPLAYVERLPSGDWSPYLPTDEVQWGTGGDKMNCVTQSFHNSIEIQLTFLRAAGKLSDRAWNWLKNKGYIDANGKVNFNDRISAVLNETQSDGNYLWKVADYARKFGLFPESVLPSDENLSWADYYKRDLITQDILKFGTESKDYFEIWFEWLPLSKVDLTKHLKHAPIQIVFPNHAVANIQVRNNADIARYFDTYNPFVKDIGFQNLTAAFKIIIVEKGQQTKFYKVLQEGKAGIMVLEGFSGTLLFENDYAEYLTLLKITGMDDTIPLVTIPAGKFFRINDHGKQGILVSEGFSGTILFENDWAEYLTLLNISGLKQTDPVISVP